MSAFDINLYVGISLSRSLPVQKSSWVYSFIYLSLCYGISKFDIWLIKHRIKKNKYSFPNTFVKFCINFTNPLQTFALGKLNDINS